MVNGTKQSGNKWAKIFAITTILAIFFLGNATGMVTAFATFFRTLSLDSNPLPGYGYGYGVDGVTYGYGYGYGYDTTPDAFAFTALTGKELSTSYESNTITVAGLNTSAAISIAGGEYYIVRNISESSFGFDTAYATPSPTWTSTWGTVYNGDVVKVRLTSAATYSTLASASLTIGTASATFNVTTKVYSGGGGSGGGGFGGGSTTTTSGNASTSHTTTTTTVNGNTTTTTTTEGRRSTVTTTTNGVTTTEVKIKTPSGVEVPMIPACGLSPQKNVLTSLSQIKLFDSKDSWAKRYIYRLAIRGTIDNVDAFRPNDRVTRAEFLKMVMTAAGCVPSGTGAINFTDVASDAWYAPYVSLALTTHVISDQFEKFRPDDFISRGEASKIIAGIFKLDLSNVQVTFEDLDPASDLAKYIETSKSLGFFTGELVGGKLKFRPNDSILRAEVAKVVVDAFGL